MVFFIAITPISALTIAPVDVRVMDIKSLTRAMEIGLITSEQLVNIYLERIEKYNEEFNAINFINENAVKEARELDRKRREGNIKGLLHGIPIIVKANIDVVGLPTTAGARALEENMPKRDAEVVKRLRDAGAIIIASANMSEFGFSARDSRSSYGSVRNAWNHLYTPYGSSGGSSVSVALSFAAASLGTDTNSSIRIPVSAAYLVGFRPTFDLLSMRGIIPYDTTRDVVGPITKTVSDSAILMSVMGDIDYTRNISENGLEGKVIGVATELHIGNNNALVVHNLRTYGPIIDLMSEKIEKMENAGATIVNIDRVITPHYFGIARNTMAGFTMCDGFTEYIKGTTGPIRSFRDLVNAPGKTQSLREHLNGCNQPVRNSLRNRRAEYERHITTIFEDNNLDALIYPTTKNKLMLLNSTDNTLNSPGTNLPSVIGFPSVSMPLGFDSDNLPYGIEFLGRKGSEDILFQIISGYEALFNEIKVTPLAPSLYEIPESVTILVENYKRILEIERPNRTTKNLIKDIKEYFANYESNENREIDAERLNNRYDRLNSNDWFYFLSRITRIIFITIISFRIFVKVVRFMVKRKRKIKRKKSKRS